VDESSNVWKDVFLNIVMLAVLLIVHAGTSVNS
jgi:hypothetical protein